MFKGIINNIGVIRCIDSNFCLTIQSTDDHYFIDSKIGDSVSCAGICLTIIKIDAYNLIKVEVSPETLAVSDVKNWHLEHKINLELAMKLSERLDGHLVQGHIDGVAIIKEIIYNNSSHELRLCLLQKDLYKFIAKKGSVAVDGVSLTVNNVNDDSFVVNIIPHTWHNTTFQYCCTGSHLNIEVDLIARYLDRLNNRINN